MLFYSISSKIFNYSNFLIFFLKFLEWFLLKSIIPNFSHLTINLGGGIPPTEGVRG